MDAAERIETVKRYLRRTYAADVVGLRRLAADIFERRGATHAVTITGHTFDGGSSSGVLTLEPLAYLRAVEEVLAELDDTAPLEAPSVAYVRFSR